MFREGWEIKNFEKYVLNLFKKDEECFEHFKSRCKEKNCSNPVIDNDPCYEHVALQTIYPYQ